MKNKGKTEEMKALKSRHGTASMILKWTLTILFSTVVRWLLIYFDFGEVFKRRVEISSPITSWFRVEECITLSQLGLSPYSGDVCHQPPLIVEIFKLLPSKWTVPFFVMADLATGIMLSKLCQCYTASQLSAQDSEKKEYATDTKSNWIKENSIVHFIVLNLYLLNPFTILTCVAQSTNVINNFVISLLLFSMSKGYWSMASICVAFVSYISLYPIMLIVPVILSVKKGANGNMLKIFACLTWFFLTMFALLYGSYVANHSWDFIDAVYGFILQAPDLTPNMGLFWYFFLEMFDHFRLFFLVVYQINVFIYALPLAIVFRNRPMILSYALLSLMVLFQSYSNMGNLSLPFALIPLWSHLYPYMRNFLLIAGMFFFTSLLAPSMWYLWIYAGMGNANFFYAVTLAYNTAQVFLLSDVLYAFLRHQFHLKNGLSPKTKDGKEGIVIMK
eukprot:TCONS_00012432-protein